MWTRLFQRSICWVLIAGTVWVAPALAQGESEQLARAIRLYEQGAYAECKAELEFINPNALSSEQQNQVSQYIELADLGINRARQARVDLEQANAALDAGKYQLAKNLLSHVLQNNFAPREVQDAAQDQLARVARAEREALLRGSSGSELGSGPGGGGRVSDLLRRADDATSRGDYLTAEEFYNQVLEIVPGHPEATRGLERLSQHRRVEDRQYAREGTLLHDLSRKRAVLWERTVTAYREAEREIQAAVDANNYDLAKQKLLLARETLEAGREFAEPLSDYEALKAGYEALADMVTTQEQNYNEIEADQLRRDLETREALRIQMQDEQKQAEIDKLMEQAQQRSEDRDYEGAAEVLRHVLHIDPRNVEAEWWLTELQDRALVNRQVKARSNLDRMTREMLTDAEEAKVPWWREVNYPDDWVEKIRTPWRQTPGEFPLEPEEEEFEEAFRSRIPDVSFNQVPLEQALDELAGHGDMNIVPNWPDLATTGVSRETPVTLRLKDVPLRTVLEEVLEQVEGASVDSVGYTIRNGLVKIASADFLDRETFTRVYNVEDLIHPVENQSGAPDMDLRRTTQRMASEHDSMPMFKSDEPAPDEENLDEIEEGEMKSLVELIRKVVRPSSWQTSGGQHSSILARRDGNIVVTQTALGHEQIFNILDQLREDRTVQISVEARFLTVSSNFLEDMGIDLDIILNNGNAGFDRQGTPGGFAIDPTTGGTLLLPRAFSRLGFTPAPAGFGTGIPQGGPGGPGSAINQPFQNVAFVPQNNRGGNANNWSPIPILNNSVEYTSQLQSDVPGSFAGLDLPPALVIAGSFLDNIQVDFLIRATQADSRSSTLLAPKLIMTNGQQAWIAITNQQNFVSTLQPVVASGAAAQAPITDTIDTGAVLNVQAVASPDRRYVSMNVQPGVGRLVAINTFRFSDPGGAGSAGGFVQLPIVQRQQVKTTVTIPDGGTLLIGGQKTTSEQEIEAGVPVLSKIPVLKRLYSNRSMVKDEQVLLILIKPKVLIQEEQEQLAVPRMSSVR